MNEDEAVEYDAVNILALPLFRWDNRQRYRIDGGWSCEIRSAVYSNGTEQGFAAENAETILELGPMLHRVLTAGIRALADDPQYERYATALAAGDHDEIRSIENEAGKERNQ